MEITYDQESEFIGNEFKNPSSTKNMGLNPNQSHQGIKLSIKYWK